jgi:hypothetical protein
MIRNRFHLSLVPELKDDMVLSPHTTRRVPCTLRSCSRSGPGIVKACLPPTACGGLIAGRPAEY